MRNMKSVLLVVVAAGGMLGAAAPARAHDHGNRHATPAPQLRPYAGYVVRVYPDWLRPHLEFQRWYVVNRYRYDHRLSWYRLFDIYQHDRSYRHKVRRGHGHHGRHARRRHH